MQVNTPQSYPDVENCVRVGGWGKYHHWIRSIQRKGKGRIRNSINNTRPHSSRPKRHKEMTFKTTSKPILTKTNHSPFNCLGTSSGHPNNSHSSQPSNSFPFFETCSSFKYCNNPSNFVHSVSPMES
mmetsp:Transcript_20224/g.38421  ORF Transcript_20224/g.38421 Transcript_20224/m.38421 type:complete len:127 (-) Transcript_20224:1302-1682(-)